MNVTPHLDVQFQPGGWTVTPAGHIYTTRITIVDETFIVAMYSTRGAGWRYVIYQDTDMQWIVESLEAKTMIDTQNDLFNNLNSIAEQKEP